MNFKDFGNMLCRSLLFISVLVIGTSSGCSTLGLSPGSAVSTASSSLIGYSAYSYAREHDVSLGSDDTDTDEGRENEHRFVGVVTMFAVWFLMKKPRDSIDMSYQTANATAGLKALATEPLQTWGKTQ